jgi:hypothetical protein
MTMISQSGIWWVSFGQSFHNGNLTFGNPKSPAITRLSIFDETDYSIAPQTATQLLLQVRIIPY